MLTQQERDALGKDLIDLALLYGYQATREEIRQFIDVLQRFADSTLVEYQGAITKYSQDRKNIRFPIPAQIIACMRTELSPEARANEAATRIRAAISKFGWAQPSEARAWIGELGWGIVTRVGGWVYICENHGVDLNPLTFHAQARDIAKSMIEQNQVGTLDQPIGLPEPAKREGLVSAKEFILDFKPQNYAEKERK